MEGSSRNKLMMFIIIILLILTIGGIGGVSWYVINRLNVAEAAEPPIPTPAPVQTLNIAELRTFSAGTITRNLHNPQPGTMRGWFAQVDVAFDIDGERDVDGELFALMEAREYLIRDIINSIIGNYTYEQLIAPNGWDILREEIHLEVSERLQTNLIVNVVFSRFQLLPV